jgi:pSer/pThr/pTyr-binding forkhead associated (FHA) protein
MFINSPTGRKIVRNHDVFDPDAAIRGMQPLDCVRSQHGVFRRLDDGYYSSNSDGCAEQTVDSPLAILKSDSLNRRELTLKAVAGLCGGAIGWAPVELASHNSHLGQAQTWGDLIAYYVSAAIAAGLIGAFITSVEGSQVRISPESRSRFNRGFVICFLLSFISTALGNYAFNAVLQAGGVGFNLNGEMVSGSIVTLVIARLLGWAIDGALVGAGVGLATRTIENIPKGAIGGLVGGAVGGIFFDLIGFFVGGGLASRFFGEAVTGLAIGLFVGLVQELTKSAWITVEQGRLKGRQYRIEGVRASIGRAEENPVGLFGDTTVQQRHAVIERRGSDYVIKSLAVQDGTFVNGQRIETVDLHDGDRINIGGYEMMFHVRGTPGGARHSELVTDAVNPAHVAARLAGTKAKVDGPSLIDASGQPYPVRANAVTRVGRALDNEIVVSHSSVSRHHASIENFNGSFVLKDLNSQNGTFVANRRVTEPTRVSDGDAVRFGDAQYIFRG